MTRYTKFSIPIDDTGGNFTRPSSKSQNRVNLVYRHLPPKTMTSNKSTSDNSTAHLHLLRDQTVLVTRAIEQAEPLKYQLESLGATVIVHPVIQISALSNQSQLDATIEKISQFNRLVFVSRNAAKFFIDRTLHLKQTEALGNTQLTAMGQSTAAYLRELIGETNIETPESSNSDGLADLLLSKPTSERILIVRADRGSNRLRERLSRTQVTFKEIVAYSSSDIETPDLKIIRQMALGQINWITITSSAIANSCIRLFGNNLKNSKLVSISPTTSEALQKGGFEPVATADQYNMNGIVRAILDAS